MPEVRGPLVTALESPLLIVSAVRAVSQSKPLMLLTPALSAGVANELSYLSALPLATKMLQSRERSDVPIATILAVPKRKDGPSDGSEKERPRFYSGPFVVAFRFAVQQQPRKRPLPTA